MMKTKNLILIGTSHIAKESIKKVEEVILKEKPDIVALELDKPRLIGLLNEGKKKNKYSIKAIFQVGLKGFIFSLIGEYVERKLGKLVGVKPGDEMRKAYAVAQKEKIKVALIDQDIRITLKRLSQSITWKEKFRFFWDIIKSPFIRKKIPFDLNKVPSEALIKQLVGQVKDRYPNVYNVLIKERNDVMGKNLAKLMMKFPEYKVVAIIGAGHETEIKSIVEKNINA